MAWAAERRILIIGVVLVALALVAGAIAYLTLAVAPSCTDGKWNQDEEDVDCGGSCPFYCASRVAAPIVSFARALPGAGGRIDLIAYIENPNRSLAARSARFSVEAYSVDHTLIGERAAMIDLPPGTGSPIPIFIPGFAQAGSGVPVQAFLEFDQASLRWFASEDARLLPSIADPIVENASTTPRITAAVRNPHVSALKDLRLVATVFDAEGTAIAASQTVIAELAPGATVDAVFTWPLPFPAPSAVVDVRAVVPLP